MAEDFVFPYWSAWQILDNHLALVEALGFPEVTRLGSKASRLRSHLEANLKALLEAAPLESLHRRHLAGPPTVGSVSLTVEPPRSSILQRTALTLSFPTLRWSHADAELAYVPALGIEVIAARPQDLDERVPREIRAALARRPTPLTLRDLVALQRCEKVTVERRTVRVRLRSARARARAAQRERDDRPSVLAQVATPLPLAAAPPAIGLERPVEQLAELLAGRVSRSVLLVGPSGVGKTTVVGELARRRSDFQLAATPFFTTSGARLVAGMSGFGMWQQRCQEMVREASRRRAVVHLGNLGELLHVGKSEYQSSGIAAFLRPYVARGELLAVAECTPEQVPPIEREDPHLLDAFVRLDVAEPDVAQGRAILAHAAAHAPEPFARVLEPAVLDVLDRLHRRYAVYSAYPGRPLRFLHNLLRDCAGRDVAPADVLAAFARETGLPRVLLDPAEPFDLPRTRAWFVEQVLDQPEAVDLVVERLAATKAGLTRPRKPIASLLFIGPTGVGKTELAKALAQFLFGSKGRLTRFDMSEFADPVAVRRLVGGVGGDEGLLTARVREQPFSVVLLDEFEKAHADFYDLLLQVLGEGQLTDAAGRLADFTNTVVILTSNLGAASYQQGAFGFRATRAEDPQQRTATRQHFERAVRAFLRPELFNRLDRVVPFAPLSADAIRRIATRHLDRLQLRDGIRYRGATLAPGDGVAAHLARAGFDARYGARPLIRAVERELLAPLAVEMNRYSATTAVRAEVSLAGDALRVQVRARTDAAGRWLAANPAAAALAEDAEGCVRLRRRVQALERCTAVRELHNELWQLEREQERFEKARRRWLAWQARREKALPEVRARLDRRIPEVRVRQQDTQRMARLADLRAVAGRVHDLVARTVTLEDDVLQLLHGGTDRPAGLPTDFASAARKLEDTLFELLLHFFSRPFAPSDRVTLALFGEDHDWLLDLAAAYVGVVAGLPGHSVEVLAYRVLANDPPPAEPEMKPQDQKPAPRWRDDVLIVPAEGRLSQRAILERQRIRRPENLLAKAPEGLVGVALQVRGPAATPRFATEDGLHLFRDSKMPKPWACVVISSEADLLDFTPPPEVGRRGGMGEAERRRTYNRTQDLLDDVRLAERRPWPRRPLAPALGEVIEEHLRRRVLTLLDE
jgi:ATP-dependent Clp protease ATP-binding subunit ClpA